MSEQEKKFRKVTEMKNNDYISTVFLWTDEKGVDQFETVMTYNRSIVQSFRQYNKVDALKDHAFLVSNFEKIAIVYTDYYKAKDYYQSLRDYEVEEILKERDAIK